MKMKRIIGAVSSLLLFMTLVAVPVGQIAAAEGAENSETLFDTIEGHDAIDLPADVATPEEALARMEVVAENDRFTLYQDKTYLTLALVSKADGEMIFSNPYSLEGGTIANEELKEGVYSQLELTYFNKNYESFSLNSWADCVSKGQFAIREIENGVAVDMILGDLTNRLLVPRLIPAESFEAIVEKIPEADQKKVTRMYKLYSKDEAVNDNQLKDWLDMYPIIEEMDVYALKDSSLREMRMAEALIKATGYTFEDLDRDHAATNYEGTDDVMASFRVTMEYTLTEDGLVVNIPTENISFDTEYFYLNELTPMKYFGYGFSKDPEGYLLFPDGSGTLVNYTQETNRSTSKYTMKLYGRDFTDGESAVYVPQQTEVRLPVFGNHNTDTSYVASVDEGAAMGKVTVEVGTQVTPLNTVYTTFVYTDKLQYVFNEQNFDQNVTLMAKNQYSGNYTITFMPVTGENNGYVKMAEMYRDYLIKQGTLPEADTANTLPLYLEVLGAVETDETFLGFPVRRMTPLTTFEDAQTIISTLKEKGVTDLVMQYKYWANGGFDYTPFTSIKPESVLGGKKGVSALTAAAKEQGANLFFDVDFMTVQEDGWFDGFSPKKDSPRNLLKNVVGYSPMDFATNRYDSYVFTYLVSPRKYVDYMTSMLKSYQKLGHNQISLSNAGNFLYSDFRNNNVLDASESYLALKEALDLIPEDYTTVFEKGNAYVFPYADYLMSCATGSNGHVLEDEAVPFYQMVVGGKIPYSAESITQISDKQEQLLRCLETGSAMTYTVAYQNSQKLKTTLYTQYYAVDFNGQLEDMLEKYAVIQEVVGSGDNHIVNHEILAEGVRRTTFANGNQVIVNYNHTEVTVDGVTVGAKDYVATNSQ